MKREMEWLTTPPVVKHTLVGMFASINPEINLVGVNPVCHWIRNGIGYKKSRQVYTNTNPSLRNCGYDKDIHYKCYGYQYQQSKP